MATPTFKRKSKAQSMGREMAGAIGHFITMKVLMLQVLPAMIIGAAAISGAVGFGREMLAEQDRLATMTDRGTAVVQGAWWRLDFNPDELPDWGSNWAGTTPPSFCVRLRRLDSETPHVAVSCQRYGRILDFTQAPYQLHNLPSDRSSDREIPWRSPTGSLSMEFHVPEAGWQWLTKKAAMHQPFEPNWRPMAAVSEEGLSYWQVFRMEFEMPEQDLVGLWQQSSTLPIAVDAQDPTRFIPLEFLKSEDHAPIVPFVIGVGVFGAIFWSVGLTMLFPTTRKRAALVAVLTLACSPWWGQWVWRGLDFMFDEASSVGAMFQTMMVPLPPAVEIMPPGYEGESGDHRSAYSLQDSIYAPLFEGIEFQPPDAPISETLALQLAQEQVSTAMNQMTPAIRGYRFIRLACFAAAGLWEAGDLFLPAGEAWKDDPELGEFAALFLRYQQDRGHYPNHSIACDQVMDDPPEPQAEQGAATSG